MLTINATEIGYNVAENWHDISWSLVFGQRSETPTFKNDPTGASVLWNPNSSGLGDIWSGGFSFDWRPGGLQSQVIASGVSRFYGLPAGDASLYVEGRIAATGLGAAGGPAAVGVWVPLTLLKMTPQIPWDVGASRVSPTQIQIGWNQVNPSNGQPEANELQYSFDGVNWDGLLAISPSGSTITNFPTNTKSAWRVRAWNAGGGYSAWSFGSNYVYLDPAAPTSPTAVKSGSDIVVGFVSNVGYAEHEHEVWHGTVVGGVTTWDGAALATLASGVLSYTHVAPNPANVHVYRIRAKAAGGIYSGYATTAAVQLAAAPNKPTVPAMPGQANKAAALDFTWVHNPVDTSAQTAYEFSYSTNGGTTWNTTGKVVSGAQLRTIAANAYAANVALTTRVRTWGQATSGGSDGTGASPWSDSRTVTYKTIPTTGVTAPANGSTINDSTVRVTLSFAQAEAATFVKAQLELLQGATLLETLESTILVGITLATPVENGTSYTVRARVQDSNGLWSNWATSTFNVTYLAPPPAGVVLTYLPDTGYGQIDLTIPAPGVGQDDAATVTITRTINGVTETIVQDFPVSAALTFLDTTPTIHGTNLYTITTKTDLGASTTVTASLVTTECRRAYLSKGPGFAQVTVFGANLEVNENLSVASDTVEAAGRTKPIGLYGIQQSVQLKVSSFIFSRAGFSTIDQLRAILLVPGKACYRDASGRRVFGSVKGSVKYAKTDRGTLSFTMTETS